MTAIESLVEMNSALLSIIAHARSGALDHAWRLFRQAGLDNVDDDPAVLSVRGRLLKDNARAASGAERQRYWREAAEAYRRAGEIGGTTYPLINAATLSLLAGKREQSQTLARKVLERLASGKGDEDTPYYLVATKAEALLLLGQIDKAKTTLAEAIAKAPRAYEDHASTLKQFTLIVDAQRQSKAWLDPHRPPRCLHFAGHMTLAAKDDTIGVRLRTILKEERIGFGYGALAAGADILVAEALLAAKTELHLVLPAPKVRFREVSVARFGSDWAARFDRIVEAADSVRAIGKKGDQPTPLAIRLAAEIAMGRAVMQADMLATEAVQVLILAPDATTKSGSSGWIGSAWEKSGHRQYVLAAKRATAKAKEKPAPADDKSACLMAMLRIDLAGADPDTVTTELLPRLARVLTHEPKPAVAPRWTDEAVSIAFESPIAAAQTALRLAKTLSDVPGLRIAGHYAVVHRAEDRFGGTAFLSGSETLRPKQMTASTPTGAIHLTEDFVAALHAATARDRLRTEYVGELPGDPAEPIKLFSLKA